MRKRGEKETRAYLDWDIETERLLHEGQFDRCYRMSTSSFEALVVLVAPLLNINNRYSISKGNMIQTTIRFIAGGARHDVRRVSGLSSSSFYRLVWKVVDAICHCDDAALRITLPQSDTEYEKMTSGFSKRSACGSFKGCVGCVDGWLCPIKEPSRLQAGGAGVRK